MGGALRRVLGSWLLFASAQWMFTVAVGVAAFNEAGAGAVGLVTVARLVCRRSWPRRWRAVWWIATTGRAWSRSAARWPPWGSASRPCW